MCRCIYVCRYFYIHICIIIGKKSSGEGARDSKATPAEQGSQDSSHGSGDERKDSPFDDMETTQDGTSKQKEVNSTYVQSIKYYQPNI